MMPIYTAIQDGKIQIFAVEYLQIPIQLIFKQTLEMYQEGMAVFWASPEEGRSTEQSQEELELLQQSRMEWNNERSILLQDVLTQIASTQNGVICINLDKENAIRLMQAINDRRITLAAENKIETLENLRENKLINEKVKAFLVIMGVIQEEILQALSFEAPSS